MYASCGLHLPVDWVPAWPLFGILYRLQFMYDTAGALVLIVSGRLIPGFVCSALIWAIWSFMPWLVFWSFEPFYAVMLSKFCQNLQLLFASLCHWLVAHYLATFALEWEICGISSIHCSTEASELGSLLTILLETVVCSRVGECLVSSLHTVLASFVYAICCAIGTWFVCMIWLIRAIFFCLLRALGLQMMLAHWLPWSQDCRVLAVDLWQGHRCSDRCFGIEQHTCLVELRDILFGL